ncbi:MAG TPA: DUF72 domain-containing protein [candidate division Zixibacteria bacterium]
MIKIGTSGFSFDSWIGPVYPTYLKKNQLLLYYERILGFNVLEINSTYYALPSRKSMESLVKRTSPDFRFSIKANSEMTHKIKDKKNNKKSFENFKFSIQPFVDSGKLLCILAQFPYSFYPAKDNFDYLKQFKEQVLGIPIVIEFRNRYWHKSEVLDFLKDKDLGYCIVDEPNLKGLMPFNPAITSDIAYFRFHGRNKDWFEAEKSSRYDYLYSQEELKKFVDPIKDLDSKASQTLVFFNNCHIGKAVRNALMLKEIIQNDSKR